MIRTDHHRDHVHHLQASAMIDSRDHHHHHHTYGRVHSCGTYECFSTAPNECMMSSIINPPPLQDESPADFSYGDVLREWPPPQLQPINTRVKDLLAATIMTERLDEYNSGRIRVEAAGANEGEDQDGQQVKPRKRKRIRSTSPEEELEVVALSPRTLMAANRFFCEVCGKGFPREQNLQLHLRQHNLPGKLLVSTAGYVPAPGSSSRPGAAAGMMMSGGASSTPSSSARRVFVCPEESCPHHSPSRALSDLTGIRKHYSRKHGERQWRCGRCLKAYAVHSDWKAHSKICGSRDYRCRDCGEVFNRKDNYNKHRDYCKALADERAILMVAGDHMDSNIGQNQNISTGDDSSDHLKNAEADINTAELASYGGTALNSKPEITSSCSLDNDLALTIRPPAEAITGAGICLINATYNNSSVRTAINESDLIHPQLELSLGPSRAIRSFCDKGLNGPHPNISVNHRSDPNIVFSNSIDLRHPNSTDQCIFPMPHQVDTTLTGTAPAHTLQPTTTYEGTTRDFLRLGGSNQHLLHHSI